MSFEKLPAVEKLNVGCLNCTTAARVAPMDMLIAVGFGSAYVTKDGECVYDEQEAGEDGLWRVWRTLRKPLPPILTMTGES